MNSKIREDIPSTSQPDQAQQLAMYRTMFLIRRFEETVNELYMQGRIPSTLHLYIGQEAVATGVCANLPRRRLCAQHTPPSRSFPGEWGCTRGDHG